MLLREKKLNIYDYNCIKDVYLWIYIFKIIAICFLVKIWMIFFFIFFDFINVYIEIVLFFN